MAPAPHPRSSRSPAAAGAGAWRSSSAVPASSRPWANTPRSVRNANEVSGSVIVTSSAADGTAGDSSK